MKNHFFCCCCFFFSLKSDLVWYPKKGNRLLITWWLLGSVAGFHDYLFVVCPPSTVKRWQHTQSPPPPHIITIHLGALKKVDDCFYKLAVFWRGGGGWRWWGYLKNISAASCLTGAHSKSARVELAALQIFFFFFFFTISCLSRWWKGNP